eukprot:COSAG01_NODE_8009_length_2955_cov_61.934174_4_plen_81_part_00
MQGTCFGLAIGGLLAAWSLVTITLSLMPADGRRLTLDPASCFCRRCAQMRLRSAQLDWDCSIRPGPPRRAAPAAAAAGRL